MKSGELFIRCAVRTLQKTGFYVILNGVQDLNLLNLRDASLHSECSMARFAKGSDEIPKN
jgi:hypothetical protein